MADRTKHPIYIYLIKENLKAYTSGKNFFFFLCFFFGRLLSLAKVLTTVSEVKTPMFTWLCSVQFFGKGHKKHGHFFKSWTLFDVLALKCQHNRVTVTRKPWSTYETTSI